MGAIGGVVRRGTDVLGTRGRTSARDGCGLAVGGVSM